MKEIIIGILKLVRFLLFPPRFPRHRSSPASLKSRNIEEVAKGFEFHHTDSKAILSGLNTHCLQRWRTSWFRNCCYQSHDFLFRSRIFCNVRKNREINQRLDIGCRQGRIAMSAPAIDTMTENGSFRNFMNTNDYA